MSKLDRREIRFEVIWKAKLRTDQGKTYHACIHNASESGLRVMNDQPLVIDSLIDIQLICRLSRRLSAFSLCGKVIYCEPLAANMGYKIGINLVEHCEPYQQQINKMAEEGYPIYE